MFIDKCLNTCLTDSVKFVGGGTVGNAIEDGGADNFVGGRRGNEECKEFGGMSIGDAPDVVGKTASNGGKRLGKIGGATDFESIHAVDQREGQCLGIAGHGEVEQGGFFGQERRYKREG